MICEGKTQAKIDNKKEMISFIDTTSTGKAHDDCKEEEYLEVIEELESQNQRILELMRKAQQMDSNLKTLKTTASQKDDSRDGDLIG